MLACNTCNSLLRWRAGARSWRFQRPAATASACLRRPLGPQAHALRHARNAGQKCAPSVRCSLCNHVAPQLETAAWYTGDFGCDPLFPLSHSHGLEASSDPWAPLLVWDLITVLDAHRWCVCPAAPALLVDHAGAAAVPADLRSRSSYSKSRHNSRKQYSRLTPALQPFWRQSVTN